MRHDLVTSLRPAVTLGLALFALTGLAYPALVTGVAQAAFPHQAGGSLIVDNGRVIGSELIGQGFAKPGYFHGRPSAAGSGHDAMASAGSNLGPGAKALHDRVAGDLAALRAAGETGAVAPDRVTASASGLDPHLSPAAALAQVARIAAARGLPETRVRALVVASIENPGFGIAGDPVVNVLALNRELDRIAP
jgi:potassium-transporting ATPase KdpC subunit